MAVILRWVPPDPDSDWDQVKLYRETDEAGAFVTVYTTLTSSVDNYFDASGTSGHYYRVTFFRSSDSAESAQSDTIQGGSFNGYCSPDDVYDHTDIQPRKINAFDMSKFIQFAGAQLNEDIQVRVLNEKVSQIDGTKTNIQNGSNTTFYTRKFPIGDLTNNLDVTTDDLLVYSVDGAGTRTQLTVSSITPNTGQFVLASAPSSAVRLELDYMQVPVSVSDPHYLVTLACINLAAAFGYSKINIGKAKRIKFGTVQMLRHMESFEIYMKKYESIVFRINNRMADKVDGDEPVHSSTSVGLY